MTSKKSLLLIVAVTVIGAIGFYSLSHLSALSFVIGVLAATFILSFSSSLSSESDNAESNSSTKTLYVGNLPYKANESNVKELFSEYGEVFAVRLMKDKRTGKRRGFGFVVMASNDTQTAIDGLNEKEYMQRTLKVRVANDPKHSAEDNSE